MRAVRLHETNGPGSLRVEDVALPEAAAGEVRVRLSAAAFNRRDVFITEGLYPGIRLPVTLGSDGCGCVDAAGEGVAHLQRGDEVVIDPMLDWGAGNRSWNPETAAILGMPRAGTFAQFVTVPAANVYRKPAGLTVEQAAAIPLAGLTAYRALFTRGRLQSGETVLIPGAGGGVATFALLFAKQAGATVVVTSGSDEKLTRARELGAERTYNYRTQPDWHKALRKDALVDLVVDSSGGDTLQQALDVVRTGGRVVVYGGTRPQATIRLFSLFWKHVDLLGTSMGSPGDFAEMLARFDGALRPVVDRIFAMDDVVEAAQRMAAAEQFGKIVLHIP